MGVNINSPVRDPSQRTALALAVVANNLRIAEMLLKGGADHAIRDPSNKSTTLHIAATLGHAELVDLLTKAGLSPANSFLEINYLYVCRS